LLILTVSLSAYTASLAQTLDRHASDHAYYQVGADMHLVELGVTRAQGESNGSGGAGLGDDTGGPWDYLPVTEHLRMPGVQVAARVGRYPAISQFSSSRQVGWFLGVDRVDFSRTAFWRRDFATASLGALMNALAVSRNAVLLPRDFMGRHALNVGDRLRVTVQTPLRQLEVDLRIAGDFALFPTWYPTAEPLFVGNLDYLFEEAGSQMAYDVWLKTDPAQEPWQIAAGLREFGFNVVEWEAPSVMVQKEETRPERQGLFGLLSVGFGAAALFTVLGFMLYALFSFRRRFIELGVLRAIGLSVSQMTLLLASELGLLILVGMIAGTLLGALASELFIPYLQIGTGPSALVPPYMVVFPQATLVRIYLLLGLLFVITLSWLAVLLLRMHIFQAIKLGETA
jgi:putative ABC transport system permease protein